MGLLDLLNEAAPEKTSPTTRASAGGLFDALRNGAAAGSRNTEFTRLAGWLRARGVSPTDIADWLIVVDKAHDCGLPAHEIQNIARSVGRYTPKLENRAPEAADILTIGQCGELWRKQRATGANFKTGYTRLDKAMYAMFPGETLTIAGRSGCFKTTFGIEIARRMVDSIGGLAVFASLEINPEALFFRMGGMALCENAGTALESSDIAERLHDESGFSRTVSRFENKLLIVSKDALTIEQIEVYLSIARESRNVPVLLIDYMGYIRDAESGSAYDKVSRTARAVKGLAKRAGARIILLCQTSREGKDGTEPVQLHHLRDSGAIEESADNVIGLWHAKDENRLHSELLKARHGRRGARFDFINQGLHLVEDDFRKDVDRF